MNPSQGAAHIEVVVKEMVQDINRAALSRSTRAMNLLRNATVQILGQNGGGRSYGRHVASAPGQPPAPDTGSLRRNWQEQILTGASGKGNGVRIILRRKSKMFYQKFLEHGTRKMAPRPHIERIKQKARPEIAALYANL